ncbi:MAG: universal stress protein [Acidobacteriia bacterium]|nr:universal stress protein [Terriglobia bacterium]
MNKAHSRAAIRRILVALDASPHSLTALRAAVELAARMEAELLGLFVEDVHLLRLAESPLAREVQYLTARQAPLDRARMEQQLRAQAEQARKALAAAAEGARVEWSFRIVRGQVSVEVLAAAAGMDLLTLGRRGWSSSLKSRIGSTAQTAVATTMPVLLLSDRGLQLDLPVLVCYDGTAATQRAVRVAAQLAKAGCSRVTALLLAEDAESERRLKEQAGGLLRENKLQVRFRAADPRDEAALLRTIKSEEAGVLVLGGKTRFFKPDALELLLREVDTSLLLLDEDEGTPTEKSQAATTDR